MMVKEQRLIDASELIKRIEKTLNNVKGNTNWDFGRQGGLLSARGLIETAPAVDAVEVVRCKDCLYYCTSWYGTKYCNRKQLNGSYVEMSNLSDGDFCSYGERREKDAVD